MPTPIHRLTKAEMVWLANHHCKAHRHPYLTHYNCYLKEHPDQSRVGFLDIEASHLTADIGIVLSWAIKGAGKGKPILSDVITSEDITKAGLTGHEDKRIVTSLVEAMKQFDLLITYYGSRFDIPFIRTRAVAMGIEFPLHGTLKHRDAYDLVKHKFRLLSNRLVRANKALLGKSDKTEIDWTIWRAGARGNKKALAYILDHNEKDVTDLEKLYDVVVKYSRKYEPSV